MGTIWRWITNLGRLVSPTEPEREENQMAKKKSAGFSYTDGRPVGRSAGGAFNIRFPLRMDLKSNESRIVKTGVRCNHPTLIFEAATLKSRGLEVMKADLGAWDEGQEFMFTVRNTGRETFMVEEGDTLVRAVVLDNTDLE